MLAFTKKIFRYSFPFKLKKLKTVTIKEIEPKSNHPPGEIEQETEHIIDLDQNNTTMEADVKTTEGFTSSEPLIIHLTAFPSTAPTRTPSSGVTSSPILWTIALG
jgi:hypothetical protein